MSAAALISLVSPIILFIIMCFVIKNHFALIRMRSPRVDQDAAMYIHGPECMDPTAAIGMHIRPHQRGVMDIQSRTPYRVAMDMQSRAVEQRTNVHQRIVNRPRPQEHDE